MSDRILSNKTGFKRSDLCIILFITGILILSALPCAAKIDLVTLRDRQSVQTTIYNKADLTLVRDKRVLNFVKGINRLQFSWANTKIDPTSLNLEIKEQADKIDIVEITYPPGTKDLGIWQINASQACQVPVEITYFTSGISWTSYYIATLSMDFTTCDLKGYVKVNNASGEDYNNAVTRLVVGKINILDKIARLASLQYPYGKPEHPAHKSILKKFYAKGIRKLEMAQPFMAMDSAVEAPRARKIKKQGFSEYFLYTIEGTQTIPNGWSKRLLSFKAENIKVKNIYKYDPDRFGKNVVRFISFKNNTENNLGQTPLPGGEIKVFNKIGDNGELDFTGSDTTKYIPIDKKVNLNLGPTMNVKIIPTIMACAKENIIFDNKKNISGFDDVKTFQVKFSNFTNIRSTLEYTKNLDTSYFKITNRTRSGKFEKTDQDTIKFTIELAPRSTEIIGFTLTTLRGERKWQQ